jgi:hypothetical protein
MQIYEAFVEFPGFQALPEFERFRALQQLQQFLAFQGFQNVQEFQGLQGFQSFEAVQNTLLHFWRSRSVIVLEKKEKSKTSNWSLHFRNLMVLQQTKNSKDLEELQGYQQSTAIMCSEEINKPKNSKRPLN